MSRIATLLGGIGVGVVAAYLFDPERGNARRSLIRDKANAAWRVKMRAKEAMLKDTRNRLQGFLHEAKSRIKPVTPTEIKLKQRVKSEIGHVVSHPKAVEVHVHGGEVRLIGCILAEEQKALIDAVWSVPGVDAIKHKLQVYESAEGVPSLQGEGAVPHKSVAEVVTSQWRPSTALVLGAAGGILALYGTMRKDTVGKALATAGMGLVTKSMNDAEGRQLTEKLLGSTAST
jgi:gas vesicle protein